MRHYLLFIGLLLFLGACNFTSPDPVVLSWHDLSADTTLTTTFLLDDELRVDIVNPRGIGQAKITVESARLPRKLSLALHLSGLEEFRLAYGDKTIIASVSSSGDNAIHQSVILSDGQESEISPTSPYWLPLRLISQTAATPTIPLEGWFEVDMPADMYAGGHHTVTLHWIDFYR